MFFRSPASAISTLLVVVVNNCVIGLPLSWEDRDIEGRFPSTLGHYMPAGFTLKYLISESRIVSNPNRIVVMPFFSS